MRRIATLVVLMLFGSTAVIAAPPKAIFTDPVSDKAHPATMVVLHVPTAGATINGVAYVPTGAGPHPVLVICHGLPGNEKNLDLAQAVRRAGWVAVTFNYRGSWGSPGSFSFSGNLEDAAAVLDYLRTSATASTLRADPKRIVMAGHSMGGWVTAKIAERDASLVGAILISMADFSRVAMLAHSDMVAQMADDMESLAGVTAESMAHEVETNAASYSLRNSIGALRATPLLVLTSDDGLASHSEALVADIRTNGGRHVTTVHVATDHGWSDRRIELETRIIHWLADVQSSASH